MNVTREQRDAWKARAMELATGLGWLLAYGAGESKSSKRELFQKDLAHMQEKAVSLAEDLTLARALEEATAAGPELSDPVPVGENSRKMIFEISNRGDLLTAFPVWEVSRVDGVGVENPVPYLVGEIQRCDGDPFTFFPKGQLPFSAAEITIIRAFLNCLHSSQELRYQDAIEEFKDMDGSEFYY